MTGFAKQVGLIAVWVVLASIGFGLASAQSPRSTCVRAEAIDDADVARQIAELSNPSLCLTEQRFEEDGIAWHLLIVRNIEEPGPLWAVPHDDEDAAFVSAVYAVLRYGGTIVAVENGERRLVGGQDPNLAFATTPSAVEVCAGATAPAPNYAAAFLSQWDQRYPVIGLHTNWDGYLAGGGLGTISVRRSDPKMIPFPSAVAEGRFADEDTIAMLVSARAPGDNDVGRAAIARLNETGVHVIYRYVTEANNECTLADYLTLNRLAPYFNLEVEHGDAVTQAALIDRLLDFVAAFPYRGIM